jgi:hypothetical protein
MVAELSCHPTTERVNLMSTGTKIVSAVEIAVRHMKDHGYRHGPCLAAKILGLSTSDRWEVEFAYEGLTDRSPTTDPPSILLAVNLSAAEVTPLEM